MNVLFIHQNFPGQFIHLSASLAKQKGNKVVALTSYTQQAPAGVTLRPYTMLRPSAPETHPMLREQESHILHAEACAAAAFQLKREGFVPDVIVAHPGWGEALFMKDVFPQAKLVIYCEYYYALEGQDVGFDPENAPLTFEQRCRLRLKNTTNLLSMEIADAAISPTLWQKSTYPTWAQDKITVIHDGIDFDRLTHNPQARLVLAATPNRAQLTFKPGDEVLSYVSRSLEPVRGFQVFMRTLPEVLRARPNAHAIIVGGNGVSYGQHAPGASWKDVLLAEMGNQLDMTRVHFVGRVPYQTYLDLLSIGKVHTYWTTPFVLSWSFLEAASSGTPVIASATAPVLEFAERLGVETHEFFDQAAFAEALTRTLGDPPPRKPRPIVLPELQLKECIANQRSLICSV